MKKYLLFIIITIIVVSNKRLIAQEEVKITINPTKEIGEIRAINGGNLGPIVDIRVLDLSEDFKVLNIPYVRLHDVPWFNTNAVDIHTIFRDFRDDPLKEENYDFRKTDDYIEALLKTGTKIIFRLGESIEHTKRKYFVNPPANNEKWAEICKGIIRHYNHGWANGFFYDIKYWEIWNEPDNNSATWTGTKEQFFQLYEIASKSIKKEFPDIKLGGPAITNPLKMENGKLEVKEYTKDFLTRCQQKSIPFDFFSWHNYNSNPWDLAHRPTYVRNILDEHGFNNAESHLNEWNYTPGDAIWWRIMRSDDYNLKENAWSEQQGSKGAAFVANVLMLLQDEPVDMANYYTTSVGHYGIFSENGKPYKTYYTFKAFAELLYTPLRIETNYNKSDSIVICSGKNNENSKLNILASNFSSINKKLDFNLTGNPFDKQIQAEIYVIDKTHNLEKIDKFDISNDKEIRFSEILPASAVMLIKLF